MPLVDYVQFRAWFDKQRSTVQLPDDCTEIQPPDVKLAGWLVWTFTWYLRFEADRYARLWERYDRWAGMVGESRKISFAYHYGPIMRIDAGGLPQHDSRDPVEVRIDNIGAPAHLHFGSPNPHHPQSAIEGLVLETLDMFTFLRAILRHRSSGCSLDKALGFRFR